MKYLIVLMALIASGSLWADNELPACEGDARTWNSLCSYAHYEDNSFRGIYVGEWSNGKRSGQGTYTETSGEKYSGSWSWNKKSGQGTETYSDGSQQSGKWQRGKYIRKTGKWTDIDKELKDLPLCEGDPKTWLACSNSFSSTGSSYFGEWKDGQKHGMGIQKYIDGSKYSGEWKNGKKHGQGTLNWITTDKYPDGSGYIREQYNGSWKNGKKHGPGRFSGYKGVYYGNWKNDKKHGPGFFRYENQSVYAGTWKDDKQHGYGYFKDLDQGSKYVGEWKEGNKSGLGIFLYNRQQYVLQGYAYGKPTKPTLLPVCNGTEDSWSEKHPEGCSFFWENGEGYTGEWKNGMPHGQGTFTYKNNDIYSGEWKQGRWNGQGTYIRFKGNKKHIGRMQNGKLHGVFSFTSNEVAQENTIFFRGKHHGIRNDAVLKFNAMCKSEQEDSLRGRENAYRTTVINADKNLPLNLLEELSKNASQALKTEISNADYIYKNCII